MSMNELISIVLPVYNGEKFLEESIESILEQTYRNWELLVLDDCSNDKTPEIVKKYAEIDSRIYYYRNKHNLRLPRNLNKGFSLAKGRFLTWTSDDNKFRPEALEKMLAALQNNPGKDLVYASYQVIDEKGKKLQVINADPKGKEHILGSNVVGACFLYTRAAYEKVGEYDADLVLVEDFDYWQRMFMEVDALALQEVLYDYRWHSGSLTSTKKEEQFGKIQERMLLKNIEGFGKLSIEQEYYYYSLLYKSRKKQGGYNLYKWKYLFSCIRYFVYVRLLNKIKGN